VCRETRGSGKTLESTRQEEIGPLGFLEGEGRILAKEGKVRVQEDGVWQ